MKSFSIGVGIYLRNEKIFEFMGSLIICVASSSVSSESKYKFHATNQCGQVCLSGGNHATL